MARLVAILDNGGYVS